MSAPPTNVSSLLLSSIRLLKLHAPADYANVSLIWQHTLHNSKKQVPPFSHRYYLELRPHTNLFSHLKNKTKTLNGVKFWECGLCLIHKKNGRCSDFGDCIAVQQLDLAPHTDVWTPTRSSLWYCISTEDKRRIETRRSITSPSCKQPSAYGDKPRAGTRPPLGQHCRSVANCVREDFWWHLVNLGMRLRITAADGRKLKVSTFQPVAWPPTLTSQSPKPASWTLQ